MKQEDYKALCQELFGTTEVGELKKIARQYGQRNPRNAGRKRKFTAAELTCIRQLRAEGMPTQEIARQYHTSRQIVDKYLKMPEEGYTMRMTLVYHNKPCTAIDVDFLQNRIKIQNYTDDVLHRAFGANECPTWEDFRVFLKDRCFPQTRGNAKELLRELGLQNYDPLQIVEKTRGRTAEDDLHLRFQYFGREATSDDRD